ncbi:hypothetical protein HPB51_022967 [Rhipicephalus microplus]|uniref:Cytosol aminopeptidase domain-containing protein n=1 Tax=Rhipicephalus microplus TaxID=6941 RepID=A0A9J6DCZ7_RHIMP|nr:hypothetical protein HPB51_022967 [Rhipicephalus microplus]
MSAATPCRLLFPVTVESSESTEFDCVVIVGTGLDATNLQGGILDKYREPLVAYKQASPLFKALSSACVYAIRRSQGLCGDERPRGRIVDKNAEDEVFVLNLPEKFSIRRLVYSPTGPLNRDFDDVRAFADAACKGVKRATAAGSTKPLVVLPAKSGSFKSYDVVTVLGTLHGLYVPLEIREDVPSRKQKVTRLGFANFPATVPNGDKSFKLALAIERARLVLFGIQKRSCTFWPAAYPDQVPAAGRCQQSYEKYATSRCAVCIYTLTTFNQIYAQDVSRHHCRMIHLTYTPEGPIKKTLFLVGKGVTYDTGGADVKAGGHMAGMHRDKCGAAAVAGFFKVLSELRPKGVKVYGAMAMVRNSIGSECYVSDEIITSRAGVRVRIGNTDAEGRMAMADALCECKEKALNEVNPRIFTIATLTGHACIAVGDGYSIIMDNGPARSNAVSGTVQAAGDEIGDMFEVSTVRREDFNFVCGPSEYEDLIQCNNEPSSRTPRGHQMPAAFLIKASGLDKHGLDSERPLCYSHIDIAASSGPFPGVPTGAPIAALTQAFLVE